MYYHLTQQQRIKLSLLLRLGHSQRSAATVLGVSPSTLSEHRRQHVKEILDYERALDGDEFDEKSRQKVLNHAPLERLCSMSATRQFVSGEAVDIDDIIDTMFGGKYDDRQEEKPKGFIAQLSGILSGR